MEILTRPILTLVTHKNRENNPQGPWYVQVFCFKTLKYKHAEELSTVENADGMEGILGLIIFDLLKSWISENAYEFSFGAEV